MAGIIEFYGLVEAASLCGPFGGWNVPNVLMILLGLHKIKFNGAKCKFIE